MALPPLSSVLAGGRNAASFTAGAAFGVSIAAIFIIAHVSADTIDGLTSSINQLTVAIVALGSAVVPFYTVVRSWISASPEHQQAAVASRADKMVVTIDPNNATEAAMRVASLPEVKQVVTSTEIAKATPEVVKIVGPDARPVG